MSIGPENYALYTFTIILICLVSLPCWLAYQQKTAGAVVVGAACGLAAVLIYIPQIQSLTFGPMKAEMRAKIDEANATLVQLRDMGSVLAKLSVLSVIDQGSMDGPRFQTLYTIRKNLEDELTKLHISKQEIQKIVEPLNPRINVALGFLAQYELADSIQQNESLKRSIDACTSIAVRNQSSDEFKKCLNNAPPTSQELKNVLSEWTEFQQTGHISILDENK